MHVTKHYLNCCKQIGFILICLVNMKQFQVYRHNVGRILLYITTIIWKRIACHLGLYSIWVMGPTDSHLIDMIIINERVHGMHFDMG